MLILNIKGKIKIRFLFEIHSAFNGNRKIITEHMKSDGEMAQWLSTLARKRNCFLFPAPTHTGQLTAAYNSSSRGSEAFLLSSDSALTCYIHTHTHTPLCLPTVTVYANTENLCHTWILKLSFLMFASWKFSYSNM